MLIVAAALLLPFTASFASTAAPTMGLSPAAGPTGSTVIVTGDGFPARSRVQLSWDAVAKGLPIASVNGRGHFRVTITIPAATEGAHTIAATIAANAGAAKNAKTTQSVGTLGSTVFTLNAGAAATPVPTSAPTATPVPLPAPTATAVPLPEPTATAVPAPAATPAPTTSGPILVTTNDVTIDGVTITSSGLTGYGIHALGSAANPVRNLTIRNCHIKGFNVSIWAEHVTNLTIENCVIEDADYAGILIFSGVGGTISGNTISRIGAARTNLTVSGKENNAYGIALSRTATSDFTANPRSSNFLVTGNLVEDVPLWHCYDTHAGQGITFSNNIARRCPRPFFITTDGISTQPKTITVTANRIEQALHVSGGTNTTAVTLVNLQGGTVTNNQVSTTYPTPWVYDYLGLDPAGSVNVTVSGQVATR